MLRKMVFVFQISMSVEARRADVRHVVSIMLVAIVVSVTQDTDSCQMANSVKVKLCTFLLEP